MRALVRPGQEAMRQLAMVGLCVVVTATAVEARAGSEPLAELDQRILQEHAGLEAARGEVMELRGQSEWVAGQRPEPMVEYMLEVGAPWGEHRTVGHAVELMQPLRWPGARAAEAAPLEAAAEAAEHQERMVAMDAMKQLRLVLVELETVDALLDQVADEVGLIDDSLGVLEATAGVTGEDHGQFYQLELAREQALDRRDELETRRDEALARLGGLLEGEVQWEAMGWEAWEMEPPAWEELAGWVEAYAPEVEVDRAREQQAQQELALVDQRRRPQPSIMVGYSNKAPMWEMDGPRDQMVHLGVGFNLPVWGSSYDREASARVAGTESAALATSQRVRDQIAEAREVYDAWRRLEQRKVRYQREMAPLARDLAAQVLVGMELGERSASDFLTALNQEVEVEQGLIELRGEAVKKQIEIQRLSGGRLGQDAR